MLEKPTFPKPRTIREDFLPDPMKNYRIKKVTEHGTPKYYPQEKILWWWEDIFRFSRYNFGGSFPTLEEAKQALHKKVYEEKRLEYIYNLGKKVEYIYDLK